MDIGFRRAGFQIAVAVEIDASCCKTLHANDPDLPIINKSIVDVSTAEILETAGLKVGEAALVIGGPPCQSFSLAGLRKGLDDERGRLLFEYVRVVRESLPTAFVLENVKGLTNWDHGHAMQLLLDELSKPINMDGKVFKYTISQPQILNAVEYNVPQYRERLIVVGNREGKPFLYPTPHIFEPPKTVWDAIGTLPKPDAPSENALRIAETITERRKKYGY